MDGIDHGRRLGERLTPDGDILVTWRTDRPRRPLSRRPAPVARVADISVTGVGLVGPDDADLGCGSVLMVDFDGAPAVLRVRHRTALAEPGWCLYGTEFVEADPRVHEWVNQLLDGRRSRRLLDAWNHGL